MEPWMPIQNLTIRGFIEGRELVLLQNQIFPVMYVLEITHLHDL